MQIHQLKLETRPGRKRVGRGGKRGKTSGRGSKGQKARSGAHVDPLFEGGRSSFTERLKKVRGFKSIHQKKTTVTLKALEERLDEGATVTRALLIEKRLVPKSALHHGVKIVGTGELKKKLMLGGDVDVSEGAKAAFQK